MLQQAQHERLVEDPAVEAIDLVKDFGDTRAVDGISLAVPAGSIYGMLGPNGAGKTTALRLLLGIIDPSSGSRRLLGRDRPLDAASEFGYLPEERGLYPSMTARETRLVCLPCQPMPAAALSGFSITGAVSTNTFSSDGAWLTMNRASALSPFLTVL